MTLTSKFIAVEIDSFPPARYLEVEVGEVGGGEDDEEEDEDEKRKGKERKGKK